MGKMMLESIVQAVDSFGIPTQRAWPCQKAAIITRPVAAVSMQGADVTANTITILVTILSPMDLGAALCEDTALDVAELIGVGLEARCTVGSCQSDERAGVFSVGVTGVFPLSL